MEFAIGYVLYNPTKKQINTINSIAQSQLYKTVLVYDNSSETHADLLDANVIYYTNLNNDGLPKAYNHFLDIVEEENIDYICLMDQDSSYPIQEMKNMMEFLACESMDNVLVIGPRSYAAVSVKVPRAKKISCADYIINSGSFINLRLTKEYKLRYDEKIFLDRVDYDFCMNAHRLGLDVNIYEDSVLIQELGYSKKVLGKMYCRHAAIRYYYIIKARNYTNVKYKGRFFGHIISLIQNVWTMLNVLIYEDNKLKKLCSCIRAAFIFQ